jgi:hypothetical protein
VNRSPLKRKTPLRAGKPKRERDPWIKPKPKVDPSRMDCCAEAKQRAAFLVMRPCIACGLRGTTRIPGMEFRRPTDMVIHHKSKGAGMGGKSPWWETLGLHEACHAAAYVFSIHGGERIEFMAKYGDEGELLARQNASLPENLCRPA